MKRWVLAAWLMTVAGCRCTPIITQVEPARVVAAPARLVLPQTYVGQQASGAVELTNQGGQTATLELSIDPPFTISLNQLTLVRGQSEPVLITFAPSSPGTASGILHVGELSVEIEAEGLEVPACMAGGVCLTSAFDYQAAQCLEAPKAEGTACETSCVIGACQQGVCVGQLSGCDDADACTVDACSETQGCSHALRQCPAPTNACQVARCDAATGCAVEDAPDGTLCGTDDCREFDVDVCITGQCVRRPRPATGRCANRWLPMSIPGRGAHAMAWDAARGKLIVFGGGRTPLNDTWEYDGVSWTQRTPATSPPARSGHRMAYDAFRQRIVLFGGTDGAGALFADTWEWDGITWVQRAPLVSPPARADHAMVYDDARRRVVLFSGYSGSGYHSDTWLWDGSSWALQSPQATPPSRYLHAMAYDGVRRRAVLFSGYGLGGLLSDHWEWDGSNWLQRTSATLPPARGYHSMAWDGSRSRVVLFSGADANGALTDTWEWGGTTWVQRTPATSPPARGQYGLAWDGTARRVVLFGGYENGNGVRGLDDTWEWNGATWTQRAVVVSPPPRVYQSMAWDAARQRVVLFGGYGLLQGNGLNDLWEWDGARWTQRLPTTSPSPRGQHAMVYDAARQRVLLFGGYSQIASGGVLLGDTWEWDGTDWLLRSPAASPTVRAGLNLAFDSSAQRVVLFGGMTTGDVLLSDTWEWDGATWTQRQPMLSPPASYGQAMTWDAARQRTLLSGGDGVTATWLWDGVNWASSSPMPSPGARTGHAMAYDSGRQRVLLFGGFAMPTLFDETWEWNGVSWLMRTPVTSPLGSYGHSMAYDAARQRVVLFQDATTWLFLP